MSRIEEGFYQIPLCKLGGDAVPILIDFLHESPDIRRMTRIRKAVFPVGGLGTRFLPATKSMPKEMLPIVDKPLIHYAFEEARKAGIEQFIFVTGRNKDAIEDHFDHAYELQANLTEAQKSQQLSRVRDWLPEPGAIAFTRQQEPLGLGHAVWCARHIVGDEPFVVLLADDLVMSETPCIGQMIEASARVPGSNVAAVMDVPRAHTQRYGVLDVESEQGTLAKARSVVEKPTPEDAPSTLSIIGRYVLQPEIFAVLENQPKGKGGEIQLTDALETMGKSNPFYGYRFEGKRFDCGEVTGYIEANVAFGLKREGLGDELSERLKTYL